MACFLVRLGLIESDSEPEESACLWIVPRRGRVRFEESESSDEAETQELESETQELDSEEDSVN